MYGKHHSAETRALISDKRSTRLVGLYTQSFKLVGIFRSRSDLAKHLGVQKSTVGRYIRDHRLYNGSYYIMDMTPDP